VANLSFGDIHKNDKFQTNFYKMQTFTDKKKGHLALFFIFGRCGAWIRSFAPYLDPSTGVPNAKRRLVTRVYIIMFT
jgi:hypothetical protein